MLPWCTCQNEEPDIDTLLLTGVQTLFTFHQVFFFFPSINVLSLFQDPIQGTALHLVVVSPNLLWLVVVSQSILVSHDFDSLEECWLDIPRMFPSLDLSDVFSGLA